MRGIPLLIAFLLASTANVVQAGPPLDDVDDIEILCECTGDPALAVGTATAVEEGVLPGIPSDPCTGEVAVVVDYVKLDAVRLEYAGASCLTNLIWYFDCETSATGDLFCWDETGWLSLSAEGHLESVIPQWGHSLTGQLVRLA